MHYEELFVSLEICSDFVYNGLIVIIFLRLCCNISDSALYSYYAIHTQSLATTIALVPVVLKVFILLAYSLYFVVIFRFDTQFTTL